METDWEKTSLLQIIGDFETSEEDGISVEDLWPCGWKESMGRIAPVQVISGCDLISVIHDIVQEVEINHVFVFNGKGLSEKDHVIYFEDPDSFEKLQKLVCSSIFIDSKFSVEKKRLVQVIASTAKLAEYSGNGVLIIVSYDALPDYREGSLDNNKNIFREFGMQFFDRMPDSNISALCSCEEKIKIVKKVIWKWKIKIFACSILSN